MNLPAEFREHSFRDWEISSANLLIFNANILVTSVLVVADESKAFRKNYNGITFYNISLRFIFCSIIEEFSILFVCNSGCTIVDDFNLVKNLSVIDVDKRDN
jgi:hypothetical protein